MKKLLIVLAATAAAAAVAAAITIPAGADPSAGDGATKLATCLHAHGFADAPSGSDALALKRWFAAHADNAAVAACNPGSGAPVKLVSCLRGHGLEPPDNLSQLKPWMVRQNGTGAGKAALHACGVSFGAPPSAPKGCGGAATAKPTPARKTGRGAVQGLLAKPKQVVLPEHVGVDGGAGHPGLVGRPRQRLDGLVRDAQRRLPEAELAAGAEPEPRERPPGELLEAPPDERAADSLSLDRRRGPHGAR